MNRFLGLLFPIAMTLIASKGWAKCDASKMRDELKLHSSTNVSYGRVLGQAMAHPEKAGPPILLNAAIVKGNKSGAKMKKIHFYLQCKGCGSENFALWPDQFPALEAKGGDVEIWRAKHKINSKGGEAFVTGKFSNHELKEVTLHLDPKMPPNPAMGEERREVTIVVPSLVPSESCGECCD